MTLLENILGSLTQRAWVVAWIALLAAPWHSGFAMPLHPELIEKLKAGGKWAETVRMLREDRSKGIESGTGLRRLMRGSGRSQGLESFQDYQWSVQRQAVVILVDFSDNAADTVSYPPSHYEEMLFSLGTYATGSMADYYLENSYGEFLLTGTVVGWYRMAQTYAYYVDGQRGFGSYPQNAQKLAEDAIYAADPDVDFSQFDNDGPDGIPNSGDDDGQVDALFVIHAGPGYEETGNSNHIHSHQWTTHDIPIVDGVQGYSYSMEPDNGRIGVFCHEFGHVLGLPDLYDLDYDSKGLGMWSIMAGGVWADNGATPVHFDAWCKVQLGFLTPQVVTSNIVGASVPEVEGNPTAYELWTNGVPESQYFLVENRQKTGFDSYLPGSGLLIYHVDELVPNNNDQTHYKVAVEQADGDFDLENNLNGGDSGDPWPGSAVKRTFDYASVPDSRDYLGNDTQVSVLNISDSGPSMTADLGIRCFGNNTISGRVIDASSGLGLAGAVVTASGAVQATDTTDANGDYSLAQLCPGTYTVAASALGCWQSDPETVSVPPDAAGLDFAFETPSTYVEIPNGGEGYQVSSNVWIYWGACDPDGIDTVTIELSTDGGLTFPTLIAHGIPNSTPFVWTAPPRPMASGRIRVTAYDSLGNASSDVSDADFQVYDTEAPSVTVLSPNGFEWFEMNQEAQIQWQATDDGVVDSVSIFLSTDGGASYPYTVATGEPNDGVFSWTVPETPSDLCRIQVVAYDGGLNGGADESDFFFTIADLEPPSVTVISPAGGEVWPGGSEQNIRWIATDNDSITRIDIRYSSDGGSSYAHLIVADTPNDSLFEWTVPAEFSDSCIMRVTAYDRSYNSSGDSSDSLFAIVAPDTAPPSVLVIAPDGGEGWLVAGVDSVSIYLSTDGGATFPYLLAHGEPNDSSFTWTVQDWPSDSCLVKVVAYDPSLNTGFDLSDSLFSIGTVTVVEKDPARSAVPVRTELLACEPNPFNPVVVARYALAERQRVTLRVFDVRGRMVRELLDKDLAAGTYSLAWDGKTDSGSDAVSGIYFIRMEAGRYASARKIALLR